jgi:cytochrome c556
MHHENQPTGNVDSRRRHSGSAGRRLLALFALSLTMSAGASEGAIDYRQHVMAAVGGHMQAAADILRQKVAHEDHVVLHAESLASLAAIAHTLFPDGSEGGDTLPATWRRPDDFARRMSDFREATAGFAAAAKAGDGVAPAFQKVGQACKSCHDDYRAK